MDKKRGDISLHWSAYVPPWTKNLQLLLFRRVEGVSTHYARPAALEWVEYQETTLLSHEQPTLDLTPTDAQQLMQHLWDAGYRPNNGAGSTAEAQALRAHIAFAEGVAGKAFQLLDHQKEVRAIATSFEMQLKRIPYEKIAEFLNDDPSARGTVRALLRED